MAKTNKAIPYLQSSIPSHPVGFVLLRTLTNTNTLPWKKNMSLFCWRLKLREATKVRDSSTQSCCPTRSLPQWHRRAPTATTKGKKGGTCFVPWAAGQKWIYMRNSLNIQLSTLCPLIILTLNLFRKRIIADRFSKRCNPLIISILAYMVVGFSWHLTWKLPNTPWVLRARNQVPGEFATSGKVKPPADWLTSHRSPSCRSETPKLKSERTRLPLVASWPKTWEA